MGQHGIGQSGGTARTPDHADLRRLSAHGRATEAPPTLPVRTPTWEATPAGDRIATGIHHTPSQGHRTSLVRRPDTSPHPAARPPSPPPPGYVPLLARQPELAHRILDHLAMAIPLTDDPALAPFAIQCAHLREQLLDLPATPGDSCSDGDGCPRRLALANRIVRLAEELGERARISQPLDNQRPPQ